MKPRLRTLAQMIHLERLADDAHNRALIRKGCTKYPVATGRGCCRSMEAKLKAIGRTPTPTARKEGKR